MLAPGFGETDQELGDMGLGLLVAAAGAEAAVWAAVGEDVGGPFYGSAEELADEPVFRTAVEGAGSGRLGRSAVVARHGSFSR